MRNTTNTTKATNTGHTFKLPHNASVRVLVANKGAAIRRFQHLSHGAPISFQQPSIDPVLNINKLDTESLQKLHAIVTQ